MPGKDYQTKKQHILISGLEQTIRHYATHTNLMPGTIRHLSTHTYLMPRIDYQTLSTPY